MNLISSSVFSTYHCPTLQRTILLTSSGYKPNNTEIECATKAAEYSDWYFNNLIDAYNIVFHTLPNEDHLMIWKIALSISWKYLVLVHWWKDQHMKECAKRAQLQGKQMTFPRMEIFCACLQPREIKRAQKIKIVNFLLRCSSVYAKKAIWLNPIPVKLWTFEDQHLQTFLTFFQHVTNISN